MTAYATTEHEAYTTRKAAGSSYDVIVVGARVAGASTAMLLARSGFRVLMVDRRRPGTDTLSTHALMRGGVLQLKRLGILDAVVGAGTPPIRRTVIHYGEAVEDIPISSRAGVDALFAPRRTLLDSLLVDGAVQGGVEARFGVSVTELLRDRTGRVTGIAGRMGAGVHFQVSARIVVGADGLNSLVAHHTGARISHAGRSSSAIVYGYWPGAAAGEAYEFFYRPGASAGFLPTNEDQVCIWVGTDTARFRTDFRTDIQNAFYRLLSEAATEAVAERVRAAGRLSNLRGFPGQPGFLRQPWGPGWALVGDAGYFKDPLSTHGMTAALRDAEILARAIGSTLSGERTEQDALDDYRKTRDRHSIRLLEISDQVASYRWDLDELRDLLTSMSKSMNTDIELLQGIDAERMSSVA